MTRWEDAGMSSRWGKVWGERQGREEEEEEEEVETLRRKEEGGQAAK